MQKISLWLLALVFVAACSKSDGPGGDRPPGIDDPDTAEEGTPTPVGTPDGSPVARATIGTGGGVLQSADGQLKITVPAGAFTTSQQVSIERIANNSPYKVGHGYRLKPEGLKFAKPVSLTFNYLRSDTLYYPLDASGIAYQNAQGVWMSMPGVTIDATAKTATVQTTHFSDWSKHARVHLVVKQPVVGPGAATGLSVIIADSALAPSNKEKPIKLNVPVNDASIKGWKVTGEGRIAGSGATVSYVAPIRIKTPPETIAKVTAEVYFIRNKPETFQLDAIIKTVEGTMTVEINGGDPIKLPVLPVVKLGDNWQLATNGKAGDPALIITWPWGVGAHGFSIEPRADKATISLAYMGANYGSSYIDGKDVKASPGAVNITSMGVIDGFVTGTFTVEKGGKFPLLKPAILYKGTFKTTKFVD